MGGDDVRCGTCRCWEPEDDGLGYCRLYDRGPLGGPVGRPARTEALLTEEADRCGWWRPRAAGPGAG